MSQLEVRQITKTDKLGYGMGNFSYGLISQMIGFYMVFYATTILGISGKLVGAAVSISVIWDALTDPVMGFISDHTRNKLFGKRHIYILIGGLGIGISNYFLWNIRPEWSDPIKFITLVTLMLIVKTFITIYTTPYTALGAELSTNYNERTTIQSNRTIFFITGIMSATGLGLIVFFKPTELYPDGQFNPEAYQNMGFVGAILAIVFAMICFVTTFKYKQDSVLTRSTGNKFNLIHTFREMFKSFDNQDYRNVVLAYLFTNIASAIISTIGLHVCTYTFGLNNFQIAAIFASQFLFCIITQPFWIVVAKKIDKRPTVMWGLILSIVGSLFLGILVAVKNTIYGGTIPIDGSSSVFQIVESVLPFLPFAIFSGFGVAALFTVPLSMIADTIDVQELKTGARSEGTYYGLLTFSYKASQAIAIFLLGLLLDLIHFNPDLPVQAESTVIVLGITVTIGSIIAFCVALVFVNKYTLNHEKIKNIQIQLGKTK